MNTFKKFFKSLFAFFAPQCSKALEPEPVELFVNAVGKTKRKAVRKSVKTTKRSSKRKTK